MSNFNAKDANVLNRQLKVQRLVIPFVITGNATPASVVVANDEPSVLFLKTEGVDQITPALDTADGTPSLTAANDANGIFNLMLKLSESVAKVCQAKITVRSGTAAVVVCTIADTDGITAAGDKIVLNCDTAVDLSAANLNACLEVEYVIE